MTFSQSFSFEAVKDSVSALKDNMEKLNGILKQEVHKISSAGSTNICNGRNYENIRPYSSIGLYHATFEDRNGNRLILFFPVRNNQISKTLECESVIKLYIPHSSSKISFYSYCSRTATKNKAMSKVVKHCAFLLESDYRSQS